MADQHVLAQPQGVRYGLDVVGHRSQIVSPIRRYGVAPTALVERYRARLTVELIDHFFPSA
jgi:hypothetical protein